MHDKGFSRWRWVLLVAALLAGVVYRPGLVSASPVTVNAQGVSWDGSNPTGRVVSFSWSGGSFSNVYAGQLPATLSTNPKQTIYMYCVDLFDEFSVPSSWSANINQTGTVHIGATNPDGTHKLATIQHAGEIALLVSDYSRTFLPGGGYTGLGANASAALQLAVWNLAYGISNISIYDKAINKNVSLTDTNDALALSVNSYYTQFLADAAKFGAGSVAGANWLDPTTNAVPDGKHWPQGMVYAPEPSSLMLGCGLAAGIALVFLRRYCPPLQANAGAPQSS